MQQHPKPTSSTKPGSPRHKISKDQLHRLVQKQRLLLAQSRESKGPAVPQVQMSIRMAEADYLEFRALCTATRRTNGDMLCELVRVYLAQAAR